MLTLTAVLSHVSHLQVSRVAGSEDVPSLYLHATRMHGTPQRLED